MSRGLNVPVLITEIGFLEDNLTVLIYIICFYILYLNTSCFEDLVERLRVQKGWVSTFLENARPQVQFPGTHPVLVSFLWL